MSALSQREEEIFSEAQKLATAPERKSFLDQACRGEDDLRARVEELLSMQDDAEKFFAEGQASLVPPTNGAVSQVQPLEFPAEEPPGARIGRYKLLQKIGEGGGGIVYMAEQEVPVRRRVALKIIKLGMDTKSVIARFEAERQALAMMDHPNIARVLDAGATKTGRPYFVMELVRGVKITDYADEAQLDTRQRLDLFIQICHAIQHAHQKGIIHRDIKPSNILVTLHDGVPVPKVIDFGIAKATNATPLTDKTLFTGFGQFIGTPAYMSPEQAEMSGLDVDTRSDIYSLGVLLYELLTGKTPFDGKKLMQSGLDEMRRTLREIEPQRPSTMLTTLQGNELTATAHRRHSEPPKLVSMVRGDLDWIVLRALEKDRARRFQTANGLAMDVERYLKNEPVIARPPSRIYLLQKSFHRNRAVFISATAVGLALIVGFGTSTWLFIRERAALRDAELARANEAKLRHQSESREKIWQAKLLLNQGQADQANELVERIEVIHPSMDSEVVLRTLGEWLALQDDWKGGAVRLRQLFQVNQFDDWDNTSLDSLRLGAAVAETRDPSRYEAFRRLVIDRFSTTTNPIVAERAIKITLLLQPTENDLKSLEGAADLAAKAFSSVDESDQEDAFHAAWGAVSLALLEYRRGHFVESEKWARDCLRYQEDILPRTATAHLLIAMARHQAGKTQDAETELKTGREIIEKKFKDNLDLGEGTRGFWFDWVFARVLLREAILTVEGEQKLVGN
jgi:serine/threonine protein kinase